MKLRFLTLTLIATIGLICLTACGSTAPDTNENVPTETEKDSEGETAVETEPTADVIDLTGVWRNDGGDGFFVEFYGDGKVCTYYLRETEISYYVPPEEPDSSNMTNEYLFHESGTNSSSSNGAEEMPGTNSNDDGTTYVPATSFGHYEDVNIGEIIESAKNGKYEYLKDNTIEIIYDQEYQFIRPSYDEPPEEITVENVGAFTSVNDIDAWEDVPKTSDTLFVRSKNTISINGSTCTRQ